MTKIIVNKHQYYEILCNLVKTYHNVVSDPSQQILKVLANNADLMATVNLRKDIITIYYPFEIVYYMDDD